MTWRKGREPNRGILLSEQKKDCLTNLRFGDDVLLFFHIIEQTGRHAEWLRRKYRESGSGDPIQTKQNFTVTKMWGDRKRSRLTTSKWKCCEEVKVQSISARPWRLELQETTEIKNRLRTPTAAFHKFRKELTSRSYRLCHKLRFFNIVVTPTLTCASGTWTLTKEQERMIKSAQRKMLRLIV